MTEGLTKCARCGEETNELRILWMACFYEMNELGVPFIKEFIGDKPEHRMAFYTLHVCKECRGDWMADIKYWFENIKPKSSCGSGIYIRRFGGIVEITDEEFQKMYPGRVAVRVLPD